MIPVLYHRSEDCCGCKACANACPRDAISFVADEYGFFYPSINEDKCIGCQKCLKTCDFQKEGEFGNHVLEGYAARHKKSDIYSKSTSGGVFTALAEWVILRGGIVYGCVFDESYSPIHIGVDTLEGISSMRGSKYAQSDVGFVYREVKAKLVEDKYVLFTGTPCQVAGLYSYLGKSNVEKLLTADLICHGVPSAMTFKKYINYLEKKYRSKVERFQFRSKLISWIKPVVNVSFESGKSKWWFPSKNIYYTNFDRRNFQRLSCFRCKYSCDSRCGDITIGDFWGFQKANIQMSCKEGISCCLLNTPKATEIFRELNLNVEKVNPYYIIQGNYHLRKPSPKGKDWDLVMNAIKKNGFDSITIWLVFYKKSFKSYIKRNARKIKKYICFLNL